VVVLVYVPPPLTVQVTPALEESFATAAVIVTGAPPAVTVDGAPLSETEMVWWCPPLQPASKNATQK
jgi:hypothetical protein